MAMGLGSPPDAAAPQEQARVDSERLRKAEEGTQDYQTSPEVPSMASTDIPLACGLTGREKTGRLRELARMLSQRIGDVRELEDGYALAVPGTGKWLAAVTEFIALERECCPFLTFELVLEPQRGPLTVRMRGPPGVKEFLRGEAAVFGRSGFP